jgi:hypothetical protein
VTKWMIEALATVRGSTLLCPHLHVQLAHHIPPKGHLSLLVVGPSPYRTWRASLCSHFSSRSARTSLCSIMHDSYFGRNTQRAHVWWTDLSYIYNPCRCISSGHRLSTDQRCGRRASTSSRGGAHCSLIWGATQSGHNKARCCKLRALPATVKTLD